MRYPVSSPLSLLLVALFAALTAVGAYIKIPLTVDPFTLQIAFVYLSGALLGSRLGALSQLVYLGVGLAGFPVFTSGGGISYIFKPTFGYLIGFVLASYLIGRMIEARKDPRFRDFLLANICGLLPVYGCGVFYLYVSLNTWVGETVTFWYVFVSGFVLNVLGDFLLCFVAAYVAARLYKTFRRGLCTSAVQG